MHGIARVGHSHLITKINKCFLSCHSIAITAAAASHSTTTNTITFGVCAAPPLKRDNTTALAAVQQGRTTKNYQTYSRLALTATSTATTTTRLAVDRPLYFGGDLVNGKHSTRHNRFNSTKAAARKKMVNKFQSISVCFATRRIVNSGEIFSFSILILQFCLRR